MNHLLEQLFLTKKVAKGLLKDNKFIDLVGLDGVDEKDRVKTLQPQVGYALAMYETLRRILTNDKDLTMDNKWITLILSRTRLTKFGEKTFDGAAKRYVALRKDVEEQNIDWDSLNIQEQFIEVCSIVYSVEIMEQIPGGMPVSVCKNIYKALIPKIFEFKKWDLVKS